MMNSSLRQSQTRIAVKDEIYEKKDLIGKGSFGEVQKCQHLESGKIYAIKTIMVNRMNIDAIAEEANNMLKTTSQYVIQLIDHFYDENIGSYVLVTPYYKMGSFQTQMNREWTMDELILFIYQMSKALYDLSLQKILHLDLKPQNILLRGHFQYILCDLGCSRKMDLMNSMAMKKTVNTLTISTNNRGGGTPEYSSPDLIINGQMTPFSDIWSLGIILYKIIYGKHPLKSVISSQKTTTNYSKFHKGQLNIQFPKNEKFLEIIPIMKRMLSSSKDKDKRITWKQILKEIYDIAKIPQKRIDFIVTNFDILLEFANKVIVILSAIIHFSEKLQPYLFEKGVQMKNLITISCIYMLSITKELVGHIALNNQDFWQFYMFETTRVNLTKKQKLYAQSLQKQIIQFSKEKGINIQYENLIIVREKLIYQSGKCYKQLKKLDDPPGRIQQADFKKLLKIVETIGFYNKLQYSDRKDLKIFVDNLVSS